MGYRTNADAISESFGGRHRSVRVGVWGEEAIDVIAKFGWKGCEEASRACRRSIC